MKRQGWNSLAALLAALATAALLALIWFALHASDARIWLGVGLLMALSPFAMVWRLVRKDKAAAKAKP